MKNLIGFVVLITGLVAGSGLHLEVTLPDSYQVAVPGETLWFNIEVSGAAKDTSLDIRIIDQINRTIVSKEIVIPANESSSLVNITIPDDIPDGPYILKISAEDTSSQTGFKISKEDTETIRTLSSSLFDIFIEIPQKFKQVGAGEELIASIKLINVGSSGRIDVFLDYTILDPEENIILKRRETVAVETQANFVRTFDIPSDSEPGIYHIYAQIIYADGKYAVSDEMFEVRKDGLNLPPLNLAAIGSIALALLLLSTMLMNKRGLKKLRIRMKVARIVRRKRKQQ